MSFDKAVQCLLEQDFDFVKEIEDGLVVGFTCPNCGEMIYKEDFIDQDLSFCPVCECEWENM